MHAPTLLETLEPRLLLTAATGIDWAMPPRFGNVVDDYDKPVFYLTQDYARQQEFQVDLKLLRTSGGANLTDASWTIRALDIESNAPFETMVENGLAPRVTLPEGDYEVTAIVEDDNGDSETLTQIVVVEDHLIVSLGDSYGSGQGNPHQAAVWETRQLNNGAVGNVLVEEPVWATVYEDDDDGLIGGLGEGILDTDGIPNVTRGGELRYLSADAATALVAKRIEDADPRSSVTFLFLASNGAMLDTDSLEDEITIPGTDSGDGGLFSPQLVKDRRGNEQFILPGQLDYVRYLLGSGDEQVRDIDHLFLSFGGNDLGFATALEYYLTPSLLRNSEVIDELNINKASLTANFTRLAAQLNQGQGVSNQQLEAVFTPEQIVELDDLNIDADYVYLNEYPNPGIKSIRPAANSQNQFITTYIEVGRDVTAIGSITPQEIAEADEIIIRPLTEIQRTAASAFGWTYVDSIREAFVGHGYDIERPRQEFYTDSVAFSDPYILAITDAHRRQASPDIGFFTSLAVSSKSLGAFHPNERGHAATADEMMKHLRGARFNEGFAIPAVQIVDINLRGPNGVESVNGAQVFMEEAQQLELKIDRPPLDAIWYDRVSEIRVDWGDGTEEEVYSGQFPLTLTHRYDNTRPVYDYYFPRVSMSVRNRFNPTVVYTNSIPVTQSGGAYELTVGVLDSPPSLSQTTGSATIGQPFFLPTATDPANDPIRRVTVDWGDGTEAQEYLLAEGEAVSDISYIYDEAGTYTVGVGMNGGFSELVVTVGSVSVSGQLTGVERDDNDNEVQVPFNADAYNTRIYLDTNANGLLDDGEPVAFTDDLGSFAFNGLAPGTYDLRFDAGYHITLNDTNVTGPLVLSDGDIIKDLDLDFNLDPAFSGRVFIDENNDEDWQAGEEVLLNERIYLDLNRNDRIDLGEPTTLTDSRGVFGFQEASSLEPHVGWVHERFREDSLSIYTVRNVSFDDSEFTTWDGVEESVEVFEGIAPSTGERMVAVVPSESTPGQLERGRFVTAGSVISFDVNTWWGEEPLEADPGRTSALITYDNESSNRPDLKPWQWIQTYGGDAGAGNLMSAPNNAAQTGWRTEAVVVPYTGWYNITFLAQPGANDVALLVDSIDQHQASIHGSLEDLDLVVRPGRFALTGSVWHDLNGNSAWEQNETPAAEVQVELFSVGVDGLVGTDDDVFVDQTMTDASGDWVFDRLVGGVFFVRIDAPAGTSPRAGGQAGFNAQGESEPLLLTMSLPSAATEAVDAEYELNLVAPLIADGQRAEIQGSFTRPWIDRITGTDSVGVNGNDVPVFVFIDEADGTGSYNLFPDPGERLAEVDPVTGQWRFDDLDEGFYVIALGHEDGFPLFALDTVTVARGEIVSEIELELTSDLFQGYIGGTAFADSNRNGIRDAEELTIPGVQFELLTTADDEAGNADDRRIASTLSDIDGRYGFAGISGQHVVRAYAPEGWAFTRPGLGNDASLNSDFNNRGLSEVATIGPDTDARFDLGLIALNVGFPIADSAAFAARIGLAASLGTSNAPELATVPTDGLVRLEIRFNRAVDALTVNDFQLVRDAQVVPLDGASLAPDADKTSWVISGLETAAAAPGNYVLELLPDGITADDTPLAGGVDYAFRVAADTVASFDPVPPMIETPLNKMVLRFQQAGTGTPVPVAGIQLSDFAFTANGLPLDADGLGISLAPNSDGSAWELTNLDALFNIEGSHTVLYTNWGSDGREVANPDRPVVALPAQLSWSFINNSVPGDTDGDGDIDDADLGTSFANYTGAVGSAGGKTAEQGDTDGDGDIDDADLGTSFAAYTGVISVPDPGDTDGDGDIDDADLGTSFSNYTGALVPGTGGKTFSDGDTDGDGDVDDADLGTSFSGYTGALAPDALEQGPSMLPSSETTGLLSEKQEQEQAAWMFYDKQQAATSLQPVSSFSLFELRDIDEDEADYEVMYERLVAGESK